VSSLAVDYIQTFARNLGGSLWFNIETTYYKLLGSGAKVPISNIINLAGTFALTEDTFGTSLSDAQIFQIVQAALTAPSGGLPVDANGIYIVLTAAGIQETSGFCTSYCGWHTYGNYNGVDIKYSFVGDASACPSACMAQTKGLTNYIAADGMVSVLAHETAEAVSDPTLTAWYDSQGRENADKCAWTFGTQYTLPNGARANMNFTNATGYRYHYLVQQNWVNSAGGYCSLKF